ncbi:MAG: cytochrome c biogenesis protein CcdA [Pseudolysinimonas sp.]
MSALLLVSFVAGILTVAAPCVLPVLPVIVGGSLVRTAPDAAAAERQWFRPVVIVLGLVVSIIVFTLLLQATTALLGVPRIVWQLISGLILVGFGLTLLFPAAWERVISGVQRRANSALDRSYRRGGFWGDFLLGAALGPVFSSCSPTYALIVAAVLPSTFAVGLLYLLAYSVGLAVTLLLVAFVGQAFARRLGWLSRPGSVFSRVIGVLLILIGIAIIFGLDKIVQTAVLEAGWYDPIAEFEEGLTH